MINRSINIHTHTRIHAEHATNYLLNQITIIPHYCGIPDQCRLNCNGEYENRILIDHLRKTGEIL